MFYNLWRQTVNSELLCVGQTEAYTMLSAMQLLCTYRLQWHLKRFVTVIVYPLCTARCCMSVCLSCACRAQESQQFACNEQSSFDVSTLKASDAELTYHTHTPVSQPSVQDYPGLPVPERSNQSGFYWGKRQWVAVASAGPYACLHLAPDRLSMPAPHHSVFTGRMPFLPPNQQRKSTECTSTVC